MRTRERFLQIALITLVVGAAVSAALAQTYVSGAVSGVWDSTGSPFYVTDSVCVPSGDSLRIGPGVEVIFQGHYKFCVDSNAVLKAIGTAEDSIIFTAEDTVLTDSTGGHHGIRFHFSAEGCSLLFCEIEYGNAIGPSHWDKLGGCIHCRSSNPSIINNSLHHSYADSLGGAIECLESNPVIYRNSIYSNEARRQGGGISCDYYSNPIIEENVFLYNTAGGGDTAPGGAAIFCYRSNATISGNDIRYNISPNGAAIVCGWYSNPVISSNYIDSNSAGGISCVYNSNPIIVNCIITLNSGGYRGGIYTWDSYPTIVNCAIIGNTADSLGGGIYFSYGNGRAIVANTIIKDNEATYGNEIALGRNSAVACSLFIDNSNYELGDCFINTNCAIIEGPGNIDFDPMFVDTASGDFHLQEGSPCIDAGAESIYIAIWDTVIYAPTFDYDSVARPQGLGWDIGAYESPYSAVCEIEINRGWNLFSIPSTTSETTSAFGTSVYGYDRAVADYYTPDSLLSGDGYWALGMASEMVEVPGNLPSFCDTLYPGWNLIGAIRYPIPNSHIVTDPAGLGMSPPYGWDGADYFLADSLYPGHGYWFLSTGNGRITVGP